MKSQKTPKQPIIKPSQHHKKRLFSRRTFLCVELIAIFATLCILKNTDSYYSVYLLIGLAASICACFRYRHIKFKNIASLFSLFFAFCITLSNYKIYTVLSSGGEIWPLFAFFASLIVFLGSFIMFSNILSVLQSLTIKIAPPQITARRNLIFFLTCFAIITIIDIAILLIAFYPGILTSDSIDQVGQTLTNTYSNHHPFYFTILIKPFISIGLNIFHNINTGVALFSTFQILIVAAAFSYAMLTLYQKGFSRKTLIIATAIFAFLPYNIMYSFTMWKDVLFGAFFLVFIVSLYRYFTFNTKRSLSLAFIIISGIIICLYRSNAIYAIAVSSIIFFFIFHKRYLRLGLSLVAITILSFILRGPVLSILNVSQPDILESLAIPMQQVTRTIIEQRNTLSDENTDLINHLADIDSIADAYNPIIHDPVKNLIRLQGDKSYLSSHIQEFTKLYLQLGFAYPSSYLKAWIDQTKGYWNAGYSYWKWSDTSAENQYSIANSSPATPLKNAIQTYIQNFDRISFLQPLVSIGLTVWLLITILFLAIHHHSRTLLFLTIPLLATWGTLLIATPVFSEFRYTYFLFTCTPFLLAISFIKTKPKEP